MKRAHGPSSFWVAFLLVALARALVAASRLDELELELYSGSLAWSLVNGMPLDPHQLPIIPHNRGSVVFGLLLAPAIWVLGPKLWVIKALAVVLSAATAGLLAWLVERQVSRAAGLWAAALLALLPPTYQMVDVLALASHGDSILFTALALALLLPPRSADGQATDLPLARGHALAFGLTVGFACFFSLQCLVALPALLAVWFLRDRRFFLCGSSWLALAVAATWVVPARWMLGEASGGMIVNQSASDRALPDGLVGALAKWGRTFTSELPTAWGFELHGGAWYRNLMLVSLAVGLVGVLPRLARRQPLAVFCVLYPALVAGAYAATNFKLNLDLNLDGMGSRYLMPMEPFMALWIALATGGALRWPARVAAVAALVAGGLGWLALLDPGLAGRQPPVRGTELAFFHGHVEHASGEDPARRLEWIERVEPDWPDWRPLIHTVVVLPAAATGTPDEHLAAIASRPEAIRPYLWVSLGRTLARAPLDQVLALPVESDGLRWVLRAIGAERTRDHIARSTRPGANPRRGSTMFANLEEQTAALEPWQREALLEGLGFQLGLRLTPYQPTLLRVLTETATLADELAPTYYRAMGTGYRLRFLEAEYRVPEALSIERHLSERARRPFREGLDPAGD